MALKQNSSDHLSSKELWLLSFHHILPYSAPSFHFFNPSPPLSPREEERLWIVRTVGKNYRQKWCVLWTRSLENGCALPSATGEVQMWKEPVPLLTFIVEKEQHDTWYNTIMNCSFWICKYSYFSPSLCCSTCWEATGSWVQDVPLSPFNSWSFLMSFL